MQYNWTNKLEKEEVLPEVTVFVVGLADKKQHFELIWN